MEDNLEWLIQSVKDIVTNPYFLFGVAKITNVAWNYYHGLKVAKKIANRRNKSSKLLKKMIYDYAYPWTSSVLEGTILSIAGSYGALGCMTSFPLSVAARHYAFYVKMKKNSVSDSTS